MWEQVASWWQDGFTNGADAEYEEQILPLIAEHLAGASAVLDVGCGEGQVARLAAALPGIDFVVGVDPTWAQVEVAVQRGGDVLIARAEAAALPFSDQSFDAVVACLVFEHIEAMEAAISEVGRVLSPGGRFVFLLNHPLLQTPGSGWIDDTILEEQYWRIGPYLVEDNNLEEVEKDSVHPSTSLPVHQRHGRLPAIPHPHGRACAPAGLPGPSIGIPRRRDHSPPARSSRREVGTPI
jgi:SAM-dependent methyltransferase